MCEDSPAIEGSIGPASTTASALGTLDQARATLRAHFGYPDFRPPQIRAIEAALSGRDTLIVLPTGGGKSLCYQVPALMRTGLTVVVSPLISLMKDQVDTLARRGLAATFLNSTLSNTDVAIRLARVRDGSVKLLYLAPERLDAGNTLRRLAAVGVALFAVDEAHCISEWGHNFRPSYRRLGTVRERLGMPQTIALTATATPAVRKDIVEQLCLRDANVVVGGFDRTNLTYHVQPTRSPYEKDAAAVQWLLDAPGAAIVYAPTRKAVERVTSVLVRGRVRAVAYHAGLDDALRQRAQDAFMNGRSRVIVATSAFGMGIDKPDVRLVVHHAMPGAIEAYYQEAGRAGRDGADSTCVLLHSRVDRNTHEYFLANALPQRAVTEQVWRVLWQHRDRAGFVGLTLDALVSRLPRTADARSAEAALRALAAAGALHLAPPAMSRVWIRLLATPQRIAEELCDARLLDRELLRTLWRAVGRRLETGAAIDLDGLPPSFGGAMKLVPILQRLESEQFIAWERIGAGIVLDARSERVSLLPVDWPAIERRRQADLSRLNAMERYAQTRACRRAFVLRYFGDPEARPNCDSCDRCLGTTGYSPDRIHARSTVERSRLRRT